MSFARGFYCDKSPRGYVTAGITGTGIEVVLDMEPELKERLGHGKWTEETARRWDAAMDDLAARAEARVRKAWRERRKRARR